ncbi:hypothetical protein PROFUN_09179 [Planoprotostelium fungivorum]|uniref:Uncharacterized protein n=1 Tax=Planoprotostelium fungivorum TaxID=1890364 RepID=A0A2P6MVM6_9EUKA|nr:hypothetical protein PROFUN_09179 [Planoprotostelium fungivorum]
MTGATWIYSTRNGIPLLTPVRGSCLIHGDKCHSFYIPFDPRQGVMYVIGLFAKEEVRNLFSPISIVESASDIDPIIILRNIFGQTSTKSFATQSNVVRLRLNALEDHLVVI